MKKKTALTIAGSDSSGGAGIQADIKTMTMNGVYAMSAITALTAQNTTGVTGIMEVTPGFLGEQIDDVFTDIRPDAVKIGMVSSGDLIKIQRFESSTLRFAAVAQYGESTCPENSRSLWGLQVRILPAAYWHERSLRRDTALQRL